jgi:hypothetical protein
MQKGAKEYARGKYLHMARGGREGYHFRRGKGKYVFRTDIQTPVETRDPNLILSFHSHLFYSISL